MKRFYLLFLLIIYGHSGFSQTAFCTQGARWSYYLQGDGGPWFPAIQNLVNYTGDSIIDGMTGQKLEIERRVISYPDFQMSISNSSAFMSRSNDSVFVWENGEWELIFDMAVSGGDSRIVYMGDWQVADCLLTDTLVVDSVYQISYQGVQLEAYDFHVLIDDWLSHQHTTPVGTFIERIGFMASYPYQQPVSCQTQMIDYVDAGFRCYTDNEMGINFPDTCNLFLGVENEINRNQPTMSYSSGFVQVSNAINSTLHIYDILGKELFQAKIRSDNQSINLNGLPNGVLMIVCESSKYRITKKVIKTGS
ncbi:MAG: T9SS type A sorting domain-containing protein [Flavobacteriales bacterium]|jgi:hypothetical protein|nr:T9SS type A sorting domain-containing protein [Flavobacteriales bacterium]